MLNSQCSEDKLNKVSVFQKVQNIKHKRLVIMKANMFGIILVRLYKKIQSQNFIKILHYLANTYCQKTTIFISKLATLTTKHYHYHMYLMFNKIKKCSLNKKSQQIKLLSNKLQRARQSSIKLMGILFKTKNTQILRQSFFQLAKKSKQIYLLRKYKYRDGLEGLIKVCDKRRRGCLNILMSSLRQNIRAKKLLINLQKIIFFNLIQHQLNYYFNRIRQFSYVKKSSQLIVDNNNKRPQKQQQQYQQQLQGIRQKQQLLEKSIIQISRQKQQIDNSYRIQIVQAQQQQKQINMRIQQLKVQRQSALNRMDEFERKLAQSSIINLQQVYEMCYNNLLWWCLLSVKKNHKDNNNNNNSIYLKKQQLLQVLTNPLISSTITYHHQSSLRSYQKLQQQNIALTDLLKVYRQIYGEREIKEQVIMIVCDNNKYDTMIPSHCQIQGQNVLMYRMLRAILDNKQQQNNSKQDNEQNNCKQQQQQLFNQVKQLIDSIEQRLLKLQMMIPNNTLIY